MRRRLALLLAALAVAGSEVAAQAVPDDSPAARVDLGYRRTPHRGVDPFRYVTMPYWGLVFSGGASASNSALNFNDIGALTFLADNDSLQATDVLDAIGLVPAGTGLAGSADGEGGAYIGGPLGRHLMVGLTGQVRGYGAFLLDDGAVALLRDGNGARQEFPLGATKGASLVTAEVGAHGIVRMGPFVSQDGVVLSVGFGGRLLRPVVYGAARSSIDSRLYVASDSVAAQVGVDLESTPDVELAFDRGSGVAGDFLVRLEWPTSGFAIEALVANLGKVTVERVEREHWSFNVATTSITEVLDSLDADPTDSVFELRDFTVLDTSDVDVTLPRIIRFSVSAWANRILQLDASATMPTGGDFDSPLIVDIGSTWRFVPAIPLRAGVILDGRTGIGYTAGVAIEGRHFLMRTSVGSLGGLFRNARGAGGRVELGFFF